MSETDFSVRVWITRYLAGEISLAEFRRSFLPIAWKAGEPGGSGSALVRGIELRLAEWANGHWTEADLQGMFTRMAGSTSGWIFQVAEIRAAHLAWSSVNAPITGELLTAA